ncbi:MAG: inositol monophosphatase family protein [Candidatus Geothermincolia bacterium]
MDVKTLCRRLGREIRHAVRPELGRPEARRLMGIGAGGDSTFAIDEVAERILEERLKEYPDLAWFSEDRGLKGARDPETVLIVDPIDGTRPAAAGFEACCVSVAAASYPGRKAPSMGDVFFGYVCDIKGDSEFYAGRGQGARAIVGGVERTLDVGPREPVSLDRLFWTTGYRGRPAMAVTTVLEELIDTSSVDGSVFDLGSATYGVTRILTGQLDAYVDVGDRLIRDIPAVREQFLKVGHGEVLNNSCYDLAAVALIAREAGLTVTDAAGKDIDTYPLFSRRRAVQLSCIASSSSELQEAILEYVERGMKKLQRRYRNRVGGVQRS